MSDAVEQPVVDEHVPPAAPVEEPAVAPVDPEAAELAELEQNAVALPDGDGLSKFVPLAAVTKAREEAKALRQQAKEAATLKAELEAAKAREAAAQPYVEAAKAMLQQPQPHPEPQGPSPEERAELEEVARDLDFYKTDGSLDLDRATRHQARVRKEAERIAAAQVAPLQQQNEIARAQAVLNQAKAWKDPVTGETADPAVLTQLWNKVAQQPGGLQTLSNPEAAAFIVSHALNLSRWGKGAQPAPVARTPAPDGPPVFVEPSGGGTQVPTLSSMERKAARDLGMTEAEYLKAAAGRPRG